MQIVWYDLDGGCDRGTLRTPYCRSGPCCQLPKPLQVTMLTVCQGVESLRQRLTSQSELNCKVHLIHFDPTIAIPFLQRLRVRCLD